MLHVPNQKDPVNDAVMAVMKENSIRRSVETQVLKDLNIQNPKQIPHELVNEYKSLLKNRTDAALGKPVTLNEGDKEHVVKTLDSAGNFKGMVGHKGSRRSALKFARRLNPNDSGDTHHYAKNDVGSHEDSYADMDKLKYRDVTKNKLLKKKVQEDCIDVNAVDKSKDYQPTDTQETEMGDRKRTSKSLVRKILASKKTLRNEELETEGFTLAQAKDSWAHKMKFHGLLPTKSDMAKKKEVNAKFDKHASDENDKAGVKKVKRGFAKVMKSDAKPEKVKAEKRPPYKRALKASFAKAMSEENIQELSANLLRRYAGKADTSVGEMRKKRLHALGKGDSVEHGKLYDKSRQRMTNKHKAESKLSEGNIQEAIPKIPTGGSVLSTSAAYGQAKAQDSLADLTNLGKTTDNQKGKALGPDFGQASAENKPLPPSKDSSDTGGIATHSSAAPSLTGQDIGSRLKALQKTEPVTRSIKPVAPQVDKKPAPEAPKAAPPAVGDQAKVNVAPKSSGPDSDEPNDSDSFNTAFGKARAKAGGDNGKFTWKGKDYSTKFKLRKK